ncbi:MAG: GGDEF domain-containing protein [Spirochaetales bacterium]|nr:GGDEF domain-containing protein [Spirochaetales bacterium]
MRRKNIPNLHIAVLLGAYDENYQARLRNCLIGYACEKNISLHFIVGRPLNSRLYDDHFQNVIFELAHSNRFDGIIIVSGTIGQYITDEDLLLFSNNFKTKPIISIGLLIKDIPSIIINNKSGVENAVTHLIEVHGIKKIACVRGPKGHFEADARFEGYKAALKKHQIPYNPDLVLQGDFWIEAGYKAVQTLLMKKSIIPDAIIMPDDETALGAYNAAVERDLKVPEDLKIIGFDNSNESRYHNPPLASVSQPYNDMAVTAIKAIIRLIDKKKTRQQYILSAIFIPRDSCGCVVHELKKPVLLIPKTGARHKNRNKNHIQSSAVFKKFNQRTVKIKSIPASMKKATARIIRKMIECIDNYKPAYSFFSELYPYARDSISNELDLSLVINYLDILHDIYTETITEDPRTKVYIQNFIEDIKSHINRIYMRKNAYEKSQIDRELAGFRMFNSRLYSVPDLDHLISVLTGSLPEFGISSCYLILYDDSPVKNNSFSWQLPEQSGIVLALKDASRLYIENGRQSFPTKKILPDFFFPVNSKKHFIIMALKYKEEQFGFIIFEYGARVDLAYETICVYLNSALKVIALFDKQKKVEAKLSLAMETLEQTNKVLHSLSLKDDLTGLYNRRGFLHLSKQQYEISKRTKQTIALIFIDLDGLKLINDNYGHLEGDWAIQKTAEILQMIFRKSDIIGRLGGDEFIILAVDMNEFFLSTILDRITTQCRTINNESNKPFILSMTCGTHIYRGEDNISFDELIETADNKLYELKRKKHRENNDSVI